MFDWLTVSWLLFWAPVLLVTWLVIMVFLGMSLRVVVATNEVHIVQSRRKTTSYGKDQKAGNTYYAWPASLPGIGIRIIKLPVSVFDIQLNEYAAYDKGRVPFVIDILAFFRVDDSSMAAQRVSSIKELQDQLRGILQGASRSILAQSPIEEILEERAKYGKMFTDATDKQLKDWGVVNVKNIELMDIRDTGNSQVIQRIMAIKQSLIEKDSRVAVAANKQASEVAEIEAKQAVLVRQQEADKQVGIQNALRVREIGIAQQQADQAVKEEEKATATKAMAVIEVNTVRQAEITRQQQVVAADQAKQVVVIEAEAEKQKTITIADGTLEAARRKATGVEVNGEAEGKAQTAVLMAPVNSQIALAKEIGTNDGYQKYLVTVKQIEANQTVGIAQADALKAAQIKVIANAGTVVDGVKTAMDLLSPKGGTQLGTALEAFKNTDVGEQVINAVTKAVNGHKTTTQPE